MFCSVEAQQAGERILGTASHYDIYVLIECPKPWPTNAFSAQAIPDNLRQFIKATKAQKGNAQPSVQFLCIASPRSAITDGTRVLIYQKAKSPLHSAASEPSDLNVSGFSNGYVGYEFKVDSLEQVVSGVNAHLNQQPSEQEAIQSQDILVCTHGMRDKCCARFGQPFYRQAQQLAKADQLPSHVRLWQVSHIGGHRFAPTAISLPDGRYYGRLTPEALSAIANRNGPIQRLQPVYRGWGLLPQPVQVFEQQLLLQYGWAWFDTAVSYRCQKMQQKESAFEIDLWVTTPDKAKSATPVSSKPVSSSKVSKQNIRHYRAILERDTTQPDCVQASCSATTPTTFVKYAVTQYDEIAQSTGLQPWHQVERLITSH
ncbi:MAG: sucrase ferredoxin [Cyanobacteria bacterium P01_D01_bin.105]